MRIESIALYELSSNLIIGRDSALKYSYTKPQRGQDAPHS